MEVNCDMSGWPGAKHNVSEMGRPYVDVTGHLRCNVCFAHRLKEKYGGLSGSLLELVRRFCKLLQRVGLA